MILASKQEHKILCSQISNTETPPARVESPDD